MYFYVRENYIHIINIYTVLREEAQLYNRQYISLVYDSIVVPVRLGHKPCG